MAEIHITFKEVKFSTFFNDYFEHKRIESWLLVLQKYIIYIITLKAIHFLYWNKLS